VDLNIKNLRKSGSFVGEPVKKEITLLNGDEEVKADVWVRKLSYHSIVNDLTPSPDRLAIRIAECICDKDGGPIFRVSDVTGFDDEGQAVMVKDEKGNKVEQGALSADICNQLLALIQEVNGLGKTQS